eukprot:TRINITY_DN78917_c0_g1_i1.p1 TRINITY_DN78917_c0_g1~~TRINITY_DN78917_c0_g1_i1.p1  ORF type:complete len:363 (-),score=33.08 TRINITY_DN78917_c0_g1_i1:74-1162(-)
MAKLVTLSNVPSDRVAGLLDQLSSCGVSQKVIIGQATEIDVETRQSRDVSQVQFTIANANAGSFVKMLHAQSFAVNFQMTDVGFSTEPLSNVAPVVPEDARGVRFCLHKLLPSLKDRRSTLEIHTFILSSSSFSSNHFILILLGSAMATIGLLTDSQICLVASFFYSPLMGHLLVAIWGIVIMDRSLLLQGIKTSLIAAVTTWTTGAVIGLWVCIPGVDFGTLFSTNSTQIDARGPPALKNICINGFVACISGAGAALGVSAGNADAMTAVAFSVALFPPLVCSGLTASLSYMLPDRKTANGYWFSEVAWVSFYIYVASSLLTSVFCWGTFKFLRVGGDSIRGPRPRAHTSSATPLLDDIEA